MADSETNMQNALKVLEQRIGQADPPSDWFAITQERVNDYAEVSMDHQWIHVDVERAEIKGGMIETMTEIKIEIQGQDKPAMVAESLGRLVF